MSQQFLQDSDGKTSFKRVFTWILIICFVLYFLVNLFMGKRLTDPFEGYFIALIIYAFTGIALEKFLNGAKKDDSPEK